MEKKIEEINYLIKHKETIIKEQTAKGLLAGFTETQATKKAIKDYRYNLLEIMS